MCVRWLFSATLHLHSTTSWRHIPHFLVHYIYCKSLATSCSADGMLYFLKPIYSSTTTEVSLCVEKWWGHQASHEEKSSLRDFFKNMWLLEKKETAEWHVRIAILSHFFKAHLKLVMLLKSDRDSLPPASPVWMTAEKRNKEKKQPIPIIRRKKKKSEKYFNRTSSLGTSNNSGQKCVDSLSLHIIRCEGLKLKPFICCC